MERNREKVIKGLECCADENSCEGKCPYYSNVVTVCSTNLAKDTISLIKELTEECENYKKIAENQQSLSMERHFEIKRLNKEIERLNTEITDRETSHINLYSEMRERMEHIKSDTVKKMQERLKEKAYVQKPYGASKVVDEYDIDQIAKEMLCEEGSKT